MLRTIGSMALGVLIGLVIAVVCEVGHIFYADVVHNSPCVMPAASGSGVTEVPWIARNVVSAGSGVMTAPSSSEVHNVVKHKHVVSSTRITCLQGPCVYAEPALQPLCPPDSICEPALQPLLERDESEHVCKIWPELQGCHAE